MSWQDLNIEVGSKTSGQVKVFCPRCRNTRGNKADRSLSVNLNTGDYHCHYCEWKGNKDSSFKAKKDYKIPEWKNDTSLSIETVKYFENRGINQSTLIKARISEGLEYMPQKEKKVNTIHFNYFLENELINIKFRTEDKCFKLVPEAELIPYNLDSIVGKKEFIITEGEIDCLTFLQCGFDSVISVPNGASTNLEYLDRFIESHFDDKETIYIAVDTDKKGLLLRGELIRRFGAERCKIVTYGTHKDANEMLTGVGEGVQAVQRAIVEAQEIKLEGVFFVDDLTSELQSLFENGLQKGASIGHREFDELISFETKRLMIVTGIPGHGKSELVDEIIYRLNLRYHWKVAYFSPENHPIQLHISKIISKLIGKKFEKGRLSKEEFSEATDYMENNYFFISPADSSDIDSILERASWLVRKRGIKILVLDPYNKLENNIPYGMSETQYISKFLDRLTTFAQQKDMMIILVAHPTKLRKESNGLFEVPTLYTINGSANFYNKADYGITVYRNQISGLAEVYVQKVKFKHLGVTGVASFRYNFFNGRYQENIEGLNFCWDETNHLHKQLVNNDIQTALDFEDFPI